MNTPRRKGSALGLSFRLAWRNIWRQKRRTWLTALAMIFSNILLVFMISLQFGSYEMMINNTLRMFSGQVQVQYDGYHDSPKMRHVVSAIRDLAGNIREEFPSASVAQATSAKNSQAPVWPPVQMRLCCFQVRIDPLERNLWVLNPIMNPVCRAFPVC